MAQLTKFQQLMRQDPTGLIEFIALPFRGIGYILRWPWWPALDGHQSERFSPEGQLAFQLLCVLAFICEIILAANVIIKPVYSGTYRIEHAEAMAWFAAGFGILTAIRFIVWLVKFEK